MSEILSERSAMLKAILIGAVVSVGIIAILMCLLSVLFLLSSSLPYEYLEYILLIIEALGVTVGAYIAARIRKRQGLITGLIVSAILFLSVCIAGFMNKTESLSFITPLRAAVLLICGALAGIKGVNKKEKIRIR